MMKISDPGAVPFFKEDMLAEKSVFVAQNQLMKRQGLKEATGIPANPVYLPAPHEVAVGLVKSFTTPPLRQDEPWLYESLLHSIRVIFWAFFLSSIIGVPLGILCGTYKSFSHLFEPFIEYFRYLPAPVFAALAVAILGINDGPKIATFLSEPFFSRYWS
ncbi:MAG: hypothetical protein LUE93_11115 [Bacteroides sp.]|nr:hypothetical protein [Bacteroides sp.]